MGFVFRRIWLLVWSGILILLLTLFVQGLWTGLLAANLKSAHEFRGPALRWLCCFG